MRVPVGIYLREKRIESGLRQVDVSRAIGYTSAQFVSNVERGLCDPPLAVIGVWSDLVGANKNTVFNKMMNNYRGKVREGLGL